jgi:hypothetical protein
MNRPKPIDENKGVRGIRPRGGCVVACRITYVVTVWTAESRRVQSPRLSAYSSELLAPGQLTYLTCTVGPGRSPGWWGAHAQ